MSDHHLRQFEQLFKENFKPLTGFAMKFLPDLDDSKNVVHEVFIALWERFETLPDDTNYRSYLYTSVRNKCLNHIRDKKKVVALEDAPEPSNPQDPDLLEVNELEREIELAVNNLPEKCRIVFEMSRHQELKYAEIAEKLDISVKTVEGRMTQALKLLKDSLAHLITITIIVDIFQGLHLYFVL